MFLRGTRHEMIVRATRLLRDTIHELSLKQERVVLAVPGGRNVAEIFLQLRESDVPWDKLDIFMLDERLVPIDHSESNFRQASEILDAVIEKERLHPFVLESDNPVIALEEYNRRLKDCGGTIDIVLASSGEDGHIASLFPSHPSVLDQGELFVAVHNSPKPPSERISASARCIARAQVGVLLFLGEEKRDALKNYFDQYKDYQDCPAKIISTLPIHYVLTDQETEEI